MNPFDCVKSVTDTKENLLAGGKADLFKSAYSPWIVNKALGATVDVILYVNEMNTRLVDPDQQYLYYLNTIPSKKRWAKWLKKENDNNVGAVRKYYNMSWAKARQAAALLSSEQIEIIKKSVEDGK